MSLQQYVGINDTTRLRLNSALRYFYNMSIFLTNHKCSVQSKSIQQNESPHIYFGEPYLRTQIIQGNDGEIIDTIETKIDWWHKKPRDVTLNYLRKLKEKRKIEAKENLHQQYGISPAIGREFGDEKQQVITVTIGIDGGGSTTKAVCTIAGTENDKQRRRYVVGLANGAEHYDTLRNTFVPLLNAGLQYLKSTKLFVVEIIGSNNDDGNNNDNRDTFVDFVFAEIPAKVQEHSIRFKSDDVTGMIVGITWSYINVGGIQQNGSDNNEPPKLKTETINGFSMFDSNQVIDAKNYMIVRKYIRNFKLIISSDIKMYCTLQGRPGYCSKCCYLCDCTMSTWKQQPFAIGNIWSLESIDNEKRKDANSHGFSKLSPSLITSVDICDWVFPTLHVKLGLGNNLINEIYQFNTNYTEIESKQLQQLRTQIEDTEKMQTKSVTELDDLRSQLKQLTDKISILTKNEKEINRIRQLKSPQHIKKNEGKLVNLLNAQKELLKGNKDGKKTMELDKEKLEQDIAFHVSLFKKYKENIKSLKDKLGDMITKRHHRPVEAEINKILQKYSISRHVYHGNVFTGAHIKKFLYNHETILAKIKEKLLDKTLRRPLQSDEENKALDDNIIQLFDTLTILFERMDYIFYYYLSRQKQCTSKEIIDVKNVIQQFTKVWRKYFGNKKNITPKLHLLEVHAVDFLAKYGSLGEVSEEATERTHHDMGIAAAKIQCVKDWNHQQQLIQTYLNSDSTEGEKTVESIASSRKRKYSKQTEEAKLAEEMQKEENRLRGKYTRVSEDANIRTMKDTNLFINLFDRQK